MKTPTLAVLKPHEVAHLRHIVPVQGRVGSGSQAPRRSPAGAGLPRLIRAGGCPSAGDRIRLHEQAGGIHRTTSLKGASCSTTTARSCWPCLSSFCSLRGSCACSGFLETSFGARTWAEAAKRFG